MKKSFYWKGRRRRPGMVILTVVLVLLMFAAFGHDATPKEVRGTGELREYSACEKYMYGLEMNGIEITEENQC